VDGDLQLLAELAAMFVQDYPRMVEEVRDSIGREAPSDLESAAHTLKGRLAFFGMKNGQDQALILEMMGREHNLTGVRQALAKLELAVEDSLPSLERLAKEKGL
jgi:HPt (histidine-containing phosphotransfer) domain-containing protein